MANVFGYARVSTKTQNIERQIRNITKECSAVKKIYQEAFTGTTLHRPEFEKLLRRVKTGDTIIFDSVSRMSRTSDEGFQLYKTLYNNGVRLVFLKEPQINTDVYKESLDGVKIPSSIETGDAGTDKFIGSIMEAMRTFMSDLIEKQIKASFDVAQKEVDDLRDRTKEGIQTAREEGKRIGRPEGTYHTKKSVEMKEKICKLSKAFEGNLKDKEVIDLLHIAPNTFYKYKKEIRHAICQEMNLE